MNDVSRQTLARKRKIVQRLLRRDAVPGEHDKPRRCAPTEAEIAAGRFSSGNNGKVVFATEQAARRFAADLANGTGAKLERVYECPRGDHWHTTSREQWTD